MPLPTPAVAGKQLHGSLSMALLHHSDLLPGSEVPPTVLKMKFNTLMPFMEPLYWLLKFQFENFKMAGVPAGMVSEWSVWPRSLINESFVALFTLLARSGPLWPEHVQQHRTSVREYVIYGFFRFKKQDFLRFFEMTSKSRKMSLANV